jgi:hypothetical protein
MYLNTKSAIVFIASIVASKSQFLSDVSLPEPEVHSFMGMSQVNNLDTKIWTLDEFQQLSSRDELDCVATTEFDPALWDCRETDPRDIRLDEFDCWLEDDFSNFDCEEDRRDEWVCDEELQPDANLSELLLTDGNEGRSSGSSGGEGGSNGESRQRESNTPSSSEMKGNSERSGEHSTPSGEGKGEGKGEHSSIESGAYPSSGYFSSTLFAAFSAYAILMI